MLSDLLELEVQAAVSCLIIWELGIKYGSCIRAAIALTAELTLQLLRNNS